MNLSMGWQLATIVAGTLGEAAAEFEGTSADAGDELSCLACFDLDLIDDGVVSTIFYYVLFFSKKKLIIYILIKG